MDDGLAVRPALAWARGVMIDWGGWVRAHLGVTILLSALAFVFGWAWNTYVMAVHLDGSQPLPDEPTIATASGRPFNGLFWLLLFTLLSGLITYGWQRGWRNLFRDLAVLPRKLGQSVSHNAAGAFAMLLWGIAVALIISTIITSAVSLALGLVLLTLAATPVGTILNFAVVRLWKALAGIVAPSGGIGAILLAGPFLVMVGEALGLLLDWLLGSFAVGLILGVLAATGSILLARRAKPAPGAAATVLIGLFVPGVPVLWAGRALADDGGWQECMSDNGQPCADMGLSGIVAWFGSEGAPVVLGHAAIGGAGAGIGALLGIGLGSVAASIAAGASADARSAGDPGQDSAAGRAPVLEQVVPEQVVPEQVVPEQVVPEQGGPQRPGTYETAVNRTEFDGSTAGESGAYPSGSAESPPAASDLGDVLPEPRDRRRGRGEPGDGGREEDDARGAGE